MATTIPHRVPSLQHAIAGLTGYEDTDTLRWQPPCTGTQDGDAGTGPDGRTPRGPAPTGSAASWPTSQAPASLNRAGSAAADRRTPPPPPASERTNDMDPGWCAIHTCTMEQHSNARGTWWSHYLGTDAHGQRRYCKGE